MSNLADLIARVEGATKLRHFSNREIGRVRDVRQTNVTELMLHHTKPQGLWVSDEADENSWSAWCESESFGRGQIEHEVELAPDANVLHITSVDALDAFAATYGKCPEHQYFRDEPCIMWADVAADYDGILITPYQWERRLHRGSSWYYGWDCASGCIWRSRAVKRLRSLQAGAQN